MSQFIHRATGRVPAFAVLTLALLIAVDRTEADPASVSRRADRIVAQAHTLEARTAPAASSCNAVAKTTIESSCGFDQDFAGSEESILPSSSLGDQSTGVGLAADCTGVRACTIDTGVTRSQDG